MHDVERRAGLGGQFDCFSHALRAAADVHVGRRPVPAGNPEHLNQLRPRRRGRIRETEADGDGPFLQSLLDAAGNLRELGLGRRPRHGRTGRHELARVAHDCHADRRVAGADAVVDEGSVPAIGIPGVDVRSADLEFERGGHAVHHLEGVVHLVDRYPAVLMEVDEAGRDDEAGGVNRRRSLERVGGHGLDPPAANADLPDRIEPRLRIDHPAVGDHEAEWCALGTRARTECREARYRCENERETDSLQNIPSCSLAASDIRSRSHGGSQTTSTLTSVTPGTCATRS